MENTQQLTDQTQPTPAATPEQKSSQQPPKPQKIEGFLAFILIMVVGVGSISSVILTMYNLHTVGWFDFKLAIWDIIGVGITTSLAIMGLVAFNKRRPNAVALVLCYMALVFMTRISTMALSFAMNADIAITDMIGLVVIIVCFIAFAASDDARRLIPRRKIHLTEIIMTAAATLIIVGEIFTIYSNIDDQAKLFTSDRAFMEVVVDQMNDQMKAEQKSKLVDVTADKNNISFELEDNAFVIISDQHLFRPLWNVKEPDDAEKNRTKKTYLRDLTNDEGGKYLCELLVRNNYSIIIKIDVNDGALAYSMVITPEEIAKYL